jgi:hypothetical protein
MKWIKWNESQLLKWEKRRRKGKFHFIWFYGVVCWGTWMFVTIRLMGSRG